jgi:hypothetical protein
VTIMWWPLHRFMFGVLIFAVAACAARQYPLTPDVAQSFQPSVSVRPTQAVKPGEYAFLGFINTKCPTPTPHCDGKSEWGIIVAAVPTSAQGLVEPSFTISASLLSRDPSSPVRTPSCLVSLDGIAVRNSHIYVSDFYDPTNPHIGGSCTDQPQLGEVRVYPTSARGEQKPERLIAGSRTFLRAVSNESFDEPSSGIAVDQNGMIYVGYESTAHDPPSILAFGPGADGNVPPTAVVRVRTGDPSVSKRPSPAQAASISIDEKDDVYDLFSGEPDTGPLCEGVANLGPHPAGTVKPMLQFAPEDAFFPSAVVVRDRRAYVSFTGSATPLRHGGVAIFDLNQVPVPGRLCGGVEPSALIRGPATGLTEPFDLAIDSHGEIYVFQLLTKAGKYIDNVRVFSPNAVGDVPPIRSFSVFIPNTRAFTGSTGPFAIGYVP